MVARPASGGAHASEELDCIPTARDGAWLSWTQIHAVEHPDVCNPELYADGRIVIRNDIAPETPLGGVVLENQSLQAQDDEIAWLMDIYHPTQVALDTTGMSEKSVEDTSRLYGSNRVEGVLMTGPTRLEVRRRGDAPCRGCPAPHPGHRQSRRGLPRSAQGSRSDRRTARGSDRGHRRPRRPVLDGRAGLLRG